MNHKELKKGMRVWHPAFKWGTLYLPPLPEKSIVIFEFAEVTYTQISTGKRVKHTWQDQGNMIYLENSELFKTEQNMGQLPESLYMKILAMRPEIKLP
jgi:hypothetical protein